MKRYRLNESVGIRNLFRLNESAISDMEKKIVDAFTYAGEQWNGIMVKDVPYYEDWYLVDIFTDVRLLPDEARLEIRDIDKRSGRPSNANLVALAVKNLYAKYGDNPYPRVWDYNDFDEDENGKTNIDNACEWLSNELNCIIRMQHVTITAGGEDITDESELLTLFYKGEQLYASPDTPDELYDEDEEFDEGYKARGKARLNEGKNDKVTISDIQAAFNEAAGMYGGMTDEEVMVKCKKERRYNERFWWVGFDNPDDIYEYDEDFKKLRDFVDRYKGGKGKTRQVLNIYFNRNGRSWPDLYEMGDHSKESQAAQYISEKLDCFVCIMTYDYDFRFGKTPHDCYEGNSGVIDSWYRGIPVGLMFEDDIERMEAEIRAGKNPGANNR